MTQIRDRSGDPLHQSNEPERPIAPNADAARMLADLEEFLQMPDPLGPEGWEKVRQHIREHDL
jgi:hypothetical protein